MHQDLHYSGSHCGSKAQDVPGRSRDFAPHGGSHWQDGAVRKGGAKEGDTLSGATSGIAQQDRGRAQGPKAPPPLCRRRAPAPSTGQPFKTLVLQWVAGWFPSVPIWRTTCSWSQQSKALAGQPGQDPSGCPASHGNRLAKSHHQPQPQPQQLCTLAPQGPHTATALSDAVQSNDSQPNAAALPQCCRCAVHGQRESVRITLCSAPLRKAFTGPPGLPFRKESWQQRSEQQLLFSAALVCSHQQPFPQCLLRELHPLKGSKQDLLS